MLIIELANQIYDILEEHGGALSSERDLFVIQQTSRAIPEWRFCGHFGTEGKFWKAGGKWYVTMWYEDQTPEREKLKLKIDALLEALRTNALRTNGVENGP